MVHEMKQFRFVLMRSKCTSQVSHSTNHWLLKLILQLRVSYSGSDFVTFRSHGGKSSTFAGFFLLASNFTALTSNLVCNGESEMGKKIETQIPFAEIICPLVRKDKIVCEEWNRWVRDESMDLLTSEHVGICILYSRMTSIIDSTKM